MSQVEIKYFNVLVDNKIFFDQSEKQEVYEKIIEMSKKFITEKLLDFSWHQNYYKLIGIDLSRQANASIS